jgi:hypothetical protein
MLLHIWVRRNKCTRSILQVISTFVRFHGETWFLLFGVLQIQLIKAMDAARLTDGCDKLPDIHDSCTIADE